MITENLDKLLQKSEEAKEKYKEMEEWQIEFDAEQKKRFCNQQKMISKKIDSKLAIYPQPLMVNSKHIRTNLYNWPNKTSNT